MQGQDQDVQMKLSLVQGLMNYLGTRPYSEVALVIQAIQEQVGPQLKVAEPVAASDSQEG